MKPLSACLSLGAFAVLSQGAALPNDNVNAPLDRRAVSGLITFFEEEEYNHANSTKAVRTCGIKIADIGGWSGSFGPWHEPCSEIGNLDGHWEVGHESDPVTVRINPFRNLIEVYHNLKTYECQLTGYNHGHGCDRMGIFEVTELKKRWELEERDAENPTSTELEEREPDASGGSPSPCITHKSTEKAANGENPTHWHKHRKLSVNIQCHDSSCSVGHSSSKSYTESYDFTLTPFEWISGGFSVSKSTTTGSLYSCTVTKGHTGCIWKATAYTKYAGRNKKQVYACPSGPCAGKTGCITYTPLFIRSPNKGGSPFQCEHDDGCAYAQGAVKWTQD